MRIIRCANCNKPLFEAEENVIVVKTCPKCKVQNRVKVETGNIISYKKIS